MSFILQADHLYKKFHKTQAVEDVSIHLLPGELYGLVGPDGAGKTTMLRLLCGALKCDSGNINICGYDLLHHLEGARAQIGYLSQRFSLYEELSVLENLRFFAELRGIRPDEWQSRSQMILDFVGLSSFSRRLAGQLSGGMKQKLGLATALINKPRLLLLDEPTTGVDPVTRQDFWQLILRLAAEEQTGLLISTPYMDEASRCTRVGFMRQGKIVVEGEPQQLCNSLQGHILALSGQPADLLLEIARTIPGILHAQRFGNQFHLQIQPDCTGAIIQQLNQAIPERGGQIMILEPAQPLLEDVFIHLCKDQK